METQTIFITYDNIKDYDFIKYNNNKLEIKYFINNKNNKINLLILKNYFLF